eukprot:TRINITY_DN963_c1_g1_i1.p1 TRINITY_DN963_c1_g1~~TRINITY_DN963_c1_g1_i1.p1  ORF type:complete len:399 (+),score=60.75 TRINITY_DN963_c1_g1_i1:49-1197(+)
MPVDESEGGPPQASLAPTGGVSSSFSDVDLSNPSAMTAAAENDTVMSPTGSTATFPPTQQQQQPLASPPPQQASPFASVGVMKGAMGNAAVSAHSEAQQAAYTAQRDVSQVRSDAASSVQDKGSATLQREWDRLRQMEEQLQRKEKQLQQRELELGKNITQQPNFPKHVPCMKPQVYHDINSDILPARQGFMRRLYFSYYLICVTIVYQVCVDLGALLASNKDEKDNDEPSWGAHFGVSLIYLLGICFAFMLWYWPIYQAVSHRVPSKYRMATLGLCIAILFDVIMIVGFVGHGGCGVLFAAAVTDWKDSSAIVWMVWIGTIFWGIHLIILIFSAYRLKRFYDEDLLRSILPTSAAKLQEAVGGAMTVIAGSNGGNGRGRTA